MRSRPYDLSATSVASTGFNSWEQGAAKGDSDDIAATQAVAPGQVSNVGYPVDPYPPLEPVQAINDPNI